LRELGFLFRADGERAHGVRLTGRRFVPQRERRAVVPSGAHLNL
jgi:hypothetical protein